MCEKTNEMVKNILRLIKDNTWLQQDIVRLRRELMVLSKILGGRGEECTSKNA